MSGRMSQARFEKIEAMVMEQLSKYTEVTTQDIVALGEHADLVRNVLSAMVTDGKLTRHREGRAIWYTLQAKPYMETPIYKAPAGSSYILTQTPRRPFISQMEMKAAREKLRIGDAFRAVYHQGGDEIYVRVKAKSRYLFICEDGETFSWADLARYYRQHGRRPLGLWE